MGDQHFAYVGVRIISRLKELGLKQADLCREAGLSTTAISQYCTGKRVPDTTALLKIASVLKTSMEWILTGKNSTFENATSENSTSSRLLCDGVPLSQMEADMVAMFRLLPEVARKEVFDLVHFKYTRLEDGEKESIYSTYFDGSDEQSGPVAGRRAQGGTA